MALFGIIPDVNSSVQMRLSPEEVKKEALGRALMMIGGTISLMGGLQVMQVNPAVKSEAQGAWAKMPKVVQNNKTLAIIGVGVGVALISTYLLRSKMLARFDLGA